MVSKLLLDRRLCLALTLGSGVYFIFHLFGINLLTCPIQNLFDKPCPGCGLTRAVAHLSHGEWQLSLQQHLLAIPYIILFSLIGLSAFLPNKQRDRLSIAVGISETRMRWPLILAIATILYFLTRLVIYY